ncbi:hypothetical protein L484_015621 [Morus notabilis]|uniref:Uncharacterized protein n=1 Tax=Morus notabilis TaxID=981085 RepID=W9RLC3_9ROSA|nr:hypothetical protein L484_015621 [Morus notabilis]
MNPFCITPSVASCYSQPPPIASEELDDQNPPTYSANLSRIAAKNLRDPLPFCAPSIRYATAVKVDSERLKMTA